MSHTVQNTNKLSYLAKRCLIFTYMMQYWGDAINSDSPNILFNDRPCGDGSTFLQALPHGNYLRC